MKTKWYSLKNILEKNAQYNIIFGERSNGKTYSVKKLGIENYFNNHKQMAYIRRWSDDFTGKRGQQLFDDIVQDGTLARITGGEWTNIYYFSSRWFFCRYDENNNRITDEIPFCYGFSLNAMEHDKSTSYPNITLVCFDEFLTRSIYLNDEFIIFENVLSTIIRQRTDVTIFMLGNTVNKYACPYFSEMGLTHIKKMQAGTIDVYRYGESKLTVAVEYVKPNKAGKDSDIYFSFDNPKLKMIKGGAWEIDIYPHCPVKYAPKNVLFTYFIKFDAELLQCEIIQKEENLFTFVHPKTTPIQDETKDCIYSQEFNPLPNYHRKITRPVTSLEKKIAWFYKADKVFYSDNETGEIMRNYLLWCNAE